jgi:hypothetical protein
MCAKNSTDNYNYVLKLETIPEQLCYKQLEIIENLFFLVVLVK